MAVIRIPRFWTAARRTNAESVPIETAGHAGPTGLDAFGSEDPGQRVNVERDLALAQRPDLFSPGASTLGEPRGHYLAALRWTAVVILSAGTGAAGLWSYQRRVAAPPVSPLALHHSPVTLDNPPFALFPSQGPASPGKLGKLYVETDPPNLRVVVDGVERGMTPLTVEALEPGEHRVTVGADPAAVHRTVSVSSNERVTLVVSRIEAPGTAAGWLTVSSPIALQVREGDRVVGTTDAPQMMLPSGERDLVLANESLGFVEQRRVTIAGGKTTRLSIDVPPGALSVNAQPWAEVWLDGRSLGQTPIGNIGAPIGSHDLVFRHPQLGERRETVVVDLKQPARVAVDMRKK